MLKDYFLMALNNLRHRGIRSWLTIIGIFIGIATVVALISLGQGLQEAVTGQFSSLSADTLVIQSAEGFFGPPGSSAVRKLNEHDLDIIRSISGVEMAIPRLLRTLKIEYNDIAKFKYLASLPEDQEQIDFLYKILDLKLSKGRFLKIADSNKIIIGSDFLKKEQFEREIRVGSNIKLQGESFEVVGILEKTGSLQINNAAVILQSDMEDILEISDEIDLIMVKVVSKERVEETADLIENKIRRDRDEKEGEEDFSVQTPIQALESVNTILGIINLIVIGIAVISLFVGGIGIANTMYTSVLERKNQIGIMKAVGAKNTEVLKIFLIESGLLGLVGGIIGAIIGLAFAFGVSAATNAYFGQQLIVLKISYPLAILAVSFSFIVGLASGILPALQASKMRPVEALRK